MKRSLCLLAALFSLGFSPVAHGEDEDYQPAVTAVPYHDDYSIFDETRIHVGVSLIHSMQDFLVNTSIREHGSLRGFQLALGVDLFSQNWVAEGIVMNFPQDSVSQSQVSLTGFELRVLYERPILYGVTLHGGLGLGNRLYNIKSASQNVDRSFNSGATVLALGMDYWPSGEVSAGVEVTNHLPMAKGDDPTSLDFSVKLTGHF